MKQSALGSCFFLLAHLAHFFAEDISVICLTVVLKLAVTVFISLHIFSDILTEMT